MTRRNFFKFAFASLGLLAVAPTKLLAAANLTNPTLIGVDPAIGESSTVYTKYDPFGITPRFQRLNQYSSIDPLTGEPLETIDYEEYQRLFHENEDWPATSYVGSESHQALQAEANRQAAARLRRWKRIILHEA